LFATAGMMIFPAAGDLLTMFVALEVLSLPLYLLAGLARRRRLLAQEASLKYFLLGAFASAFFLFGVAWIYGATGTFKLGQIAAGLAQGSMSLDWTSLVGISLIVVGLLFKVGAVPFHMWTPDVYQGAPTPITGFMAAGVKVAAFGALLRLLYLMAYPLAEYWKTALWVIAILTMVIGTVIGLVQPDIKRMLAYSAIAHAGFILTGTLGLSSQGLAAVLFYILTYGVTTIGTFAVIGLVREHTAEGTPLGEANTLAAWRGLGRRNPVLAGVFAIFLLALAGIPLTSGFVGKFAVFGAAIAGGAWPLAVVGIACSAAAAFFYVRVIVAMFFQEASDDVPVGTAARTDGLSGIAIAVAAIVTILLGVWPAPMLDFAANSAFIAL
jgi:NADH-quinone oxidoreductase subunit N